MKKLILLSLFVFNSLLGCNRPDQRVIFIYRNIPQWNYVDCSILPFGLNTAALAAKDTIYKTDRFYYKGGSTYKVYNPDCLFVLRFDNITRECVIKFHARDDSFNFEAFKKMIDFFFLFD